VKKKPTAGSPFFVSFLFDRIVKTTKDVSVHFFMHSNNFCKLCQRIPGTFEATMHVCSYCWYSRYVHEKIELLS